MGYCHGVLSTVFATMSTWRVRGLFLVAILNLALLILKENLQRKHEKATGIPAAL